MDFFDIDRLSAIDAAAYRRERPFPWINPAGLLRDEAFAELTSHLPDVSTFNKAFGHQRRHGQTSHDRFSLKYRPGIEVPAPWRDFIAELEGPDYRAFVARMVGHRHIKMDFLWFYTPTGCSVSPHCDQKDKLAAHIFYLNTDDWRPEWGGETLILDSGRRFSCRSAPDFDDFDRVIASNGVGNRSLLFSRTNHSWHGVRPITCPEGALRKIFLVAIKRLGARELMSRYIGGLLAGGNDNAARRAA